MIQSIGPENAINSSYEDDGKPKSDHEEDNDQIQLHFKHTSLLMKHKVFMT